MENYYINTKQKHIKVFYVFLFCIENERAEQIWSGWSKFGVGGANLEWVEQMWAEQSGE